LAVRVDGVEGSEDISLGFEVSSFFASTFLCMGFKTDGKHRNEEYAK
jgi:hypothetical protein